MADWNDKQVYTVFKINEIYFINVINKNLWGWITLLTLLVPRNQENTRDRQKILCCHNSLQWTWLDNCSNFPETKQIISEPFGRSAVHKAKAMSVFYHRHILTYAANSVSKVKLPAFLKLCLQIHFEQWMHCLYQAWKSKLLA